MYVIGELINCTRKRIARAVKKRDTAAIQQIAVRQVDAGAMCIDVNGGIPDREAEYLPWLVDVVQEVVDVPLCLDSPDPEALALALPECRHQPLINSITDESDRRASLIPLAKEYNARVIALCLDESGIPTTAEDRISIAESLIGHLTDGGIPLGNIYLDSAVFPVSTDTDAGNAVLDTIGTIMHEYPDIHTVCGLSNVSFGLPARTLLNQTFFILAMSRGLDAVIVDPCDAQLMANMVAAQTLLGRDEYCVGYLEAHQNGQLEPANASVTP